MFAVYAEWSFQTQVKQETDGCIKRVKRIKGTECVTLPVKTKIYLM